MSNPSQLDRGATFSTCLKYRYTLTRIWDLDLPACVFILLNPSTADAFVDDPTNRRGMNFARKWACGTCVFVNLFAFRTPSPKKMKIVSDPVGPANDYWIKLWAKRANILIAAWGTNGAYRGRNIQVMKLLKGFKIMCLGTTKYGHPKHPLYLRGDTELQHFQEPYGS